MPLPAPPPDQPAETPHQAVQRMARDHAARLYNLALRFCGDAHQAEDLVQEVFVNALRGYAAFRHDADEKTWLYRIAANACHRMHRKKAGEPEHPASLDARLPFGDPLIAVIPAEQDDALQARIHAEARERLEAEIARLPDDFRIPLILKEIVGFTVREVASILGLEEATVRTRVHRARLRLRDAVDAALPRHPDPAPPPAYDERTCLDLLHAKQEALDRGVPFDNAVICDRCRSVFATLDLAHNVCRDLAADDIPADIRARLLARLAAP